MPVFCCDNNGNTMAEIFQLLVVTAQIAFMQLLQRSFPNYIVLKNLSLNWLQLIFIENLKNFAK